MAKNKIYPDLHRENSEQAKKRTKKQRREIGGVRNRSTNKTWLKARHRVRKKLLGG